MSAATVNITLYALTILPSIIQICVSFYVLLMMILRRRILQQHRIDYLFFANIYFSAMFGTIFMADVCVYSIYGQVYIEMSFDGWWCRIKGYCIYLTGYTFFYTFALQAFYRFCRINYRTRVQLHSFRLYVVLSIGLWILATCALLPSLLIGDIKYVANDYHCQFAPTDMRGSFTVYSVGFLLPFSVTLFCYMWTMYSLRRQTAALVTINQRDRAQRDMMILRRLVIFLSIVAIAAAPHLMLPIIYVIIGYLPDWIISLEWMLTESAGLAVSISLLLAAPHLKKLWPVLNRVDSVRVLTVNARERERRDF